MHPTELSTLSFNFRRQLGCGGGSRHMAFATAKLLLWTVATPRRGIKHGYTVIWWARIAAWPLLKNK